MAHSGRKKADYLLIIEDDLVFISGVTSVAEFLSEKMSRLHVPSYLDLGGGLPMSSLGYENLLISAGPVEDVYKRPVTNTTCAYMVNDRLVSMLLSELNRNPLGWMLPIGWVINYLLARLNEQGQLSEAKATHAKHIGLKHGSMSIYQSSIQRDAADLDCV